MDRAQRLKELGIHRRESARIERELGLAQAPIPRLSTTQQDALSALIARVSPNFLSVHQENGDYVFASDSVRRVLGYDPAELDGRNAYELFHPDDVEKIASDHAEHVNGDPRRIEYRIRHADGNWLWVETDSVSATDDDGRRLIVAVTRDVQMRREMQEQLAWQNRQLQVLHEVALGIDGDSEVELLGALRIMREALGMQASMISEFKGDLVITRLMEGPNLPVEMGESFPARGSLSEYTANSVMVVAFHDYEGNPVKDAGPDIAWRIDSYIGTRLNVEGKLYGTLAFGSTRPRERTWSTTEKQLVNLVGKWIERAIELSRRREALEKSTTRLHRLATRDSLTGLLNRREVLNRVAAEIDRAQRYDTPFSIALLDLDHFKRINDNYGHKAGDNALLAIASAINRTLRTTDFCGRYGGEEFLVVWPNTGIAQARMACERLRGYIEEATFKVDGHTGSVTTSAGLAEFRPGEVLDELLARTDKALYEAKNQGRNRVVAG